MAIYACEVMKAHWISHPMTSQNCYSSHLTLKMCYKTRGSMWLIPSYQFQVDKRVSAMLFGSFQHLRPTQRLLWFLKYENIFKLMTRYLIV